MSRTVETRHARIKLTALFAIFALPPLVAWGMVTWRVGIPEQRTAHGVLAPAVPSLSQWPLAGLGALPEQGDWLLAFDCSSACPERADQWWRLHRALGREAPRVTRLRIGGAEEALPGELVARWASLPAWQEDGQTWLLDPRGEVVLAYAENVPPRDVLDDLNRLLRLNPEGAGREARTTER